jgi:hypothetical protein
MLRSGQLQAEAVERALDVIERNADAQRQLIEPVSSTISPSTMFKRLGTAAQIKSLI